MSLFQTQLEFSIFCVSTLLTLVNPIGISTVFLALTERFDPEKIHCIKRVRCCLRCTDYMCSHRVVHFQVFRHYSGCFQDHGRYSVFQKRTEND